MLFKPRLGSFVQRLGLVAALHQLAVQVHLNHGRGFHLASGAGPLRLRRTILLGAYFLGRVLRSIIRVWLVQVEAGGSRHQSVLS